jgi:hypothetical protein
MISLWLADRYLGVSQRLTRRFYKYLILWMAIGGIFLITILCLYGPRSDQTSSITLQDIVNAANEPTKKKKRILKKHETRCRKILEELFEQPFTSIRPDFLKYPKTGKNLELDGYNEELNLAFEYQGVQHRKFCPLFHETYQDFVDQLERDAYKKQQCEKLGIKVLYIPDTVPYDSLEEYLHIEVKKLNLKHFSL